MLLGGQKIIQSFAIGIFIRNIVGQGFLVFTGLLLAFFLSKGSWMMVGLIMGPLLFCAVLTVGLRPLAIALMVGPATIFVFFNSVLNAVPFVTMERVIFFSMLALILLKDCFRKESRIKLAPVEVAMLCFLFYALLSLLSTINDKPFMVWVSRSFSLYIQGYFMPLVSFMIARRMVWEEQNVQSLFKWFVFAGAFLGVTSVLQIYMGIDFFIPDYMALIHHHETRAVGTFTNASEYGLVLSVFILIGALMYTRTQGTAPGLILLGCLFLMAVGLVLGKTRGPWLGALLSLTFVAFHDKKVRPLMITLAGLGVISSALALPFLVDIDSYYARLIHLDPILNRFAIWAASINMMIQNPILGIGFGRDTFTESIHEYAITIGPVSSQWAEGLGLPHNEFIYVAALTGLVGIILFLSIFRYLFRMMRDIYKDRSSSQFEKDTTLYMGGVFIAFLVNSFLVDIGRLNYFYTLMFFLFGIVSTFDMKNKDRERRQESPETIEIAKGYGISKGWERPSRI